MIDSKFMILSFFKVSATLYGKKGLTDFSKRGKIFYQYSNGKYKVNRQNLVIKCRAHSTCTVPQGHVDTPLA